MRCSRCGEKLEDGSCICRLFRALEEQELDQLDFELWIAQQEPEPQFSQPNHPASDAELPF
jgi:hypothetical protein